ncbi:hypothetical protein HNQ56_002688 [Anaerotaenia torta]
MRNQYNNCCLTIGHIANHSKKIDAAELLGITVEPVSPSEFPTKELQTNYIKKGCSIYRYKTASEEVYIFIDCDRTTYCFYNTPWE